MGIVCIIPPHWTILILIGTFDFAKLKFRECWWVLWKLNLPEFRITIVSVKDMATDLWEGRSLLQEIHPRVFITNYFGAKNKKHIQNNKISHIVNCTAELPCPFNSTLNYLQLPLADNTQVRIIDYFSKSYEWIEAALNENTCNNVLIHCAAGSSRSGTIAIAYILSKTAPSTVDSVLASIQTKRPIILPNPGFIEQLHEYNEMLNQWNTSLITLPKHNTLSIPEWEKFLKK